MKIAVIGAGAMGGTTVQGLVKGKFFNNEDITVADPNEAVLNKFAQLGVNVTTDNAAAAEHADIVCASRYMKGGCQVGGPRFKGFLSHAAGLLLCWFARLPTHDPTNSFKLYRKSYLNEVKIESTGGFELGMELVVKARALGRKIVEVPTTWRDRVAGKSNFKLWKWLPNYLRWFFYAFRRRQFA